MSNEIFEKLVHSIAMEVEECFSDFSEKIIDNV
jgi:hypothetical protein